MHVLTKYEGKLRWRDAYEKQLASHSRVLRGESHGIIHFLEHDPVLTFGNRLESHFLTASQERLHQMGVDLEQTDRGGTITAHEPGQLVVYPILALGRLKIGPKQYVQLLEETVILTLSDFGILAHRDPINPGVWVGREKICAIGIRIAQRISLHGIALNINNDLGLFKLIVPCGIKERGVTSMSLQIGQAVSIMSVARSVARHLGKLLLGSPFEIEDNG